MEELSLALNHMMKESSIANYYFENYINTHSPWKRKVKRPFLDPPNNGCRLKQLNKGFLRRLADMIVESMRIASVVVVKVVTRPHSPAGCFRLQLAIIELVERSHWEELNGPRSKISSSTGGIAKFLTEMAGQPLDRIVPAERWKASLEWILSS